MTSPEINSLQGVKENGQQDLSVNADSAPATRILLFHKKYGEPKVLLGQSGSHGEKADIDFTLLNLPFASARVRNFLADVMRLELDILFNYASSASFPQSEEDTDEYKEVSKKTIPLISAYYGTEAPEEEIAETFDLPKGASVRKAIYDYFWFLFEPHQESLIRHDPLLLLNESPARLKKPWFSQRKRDLITKDYEAVQRERNLPVSEKIARFVNQKFKDGTKLWEDNEALELLRRTKRPIMVDVEDIQVTVAPEAEKVINALRETGTVIFVTKNSNWEETHAVLEKSNLFHPDTILVADDNYSGWQLLQKGQAAIKEYQDMISGLDVNNISVAEEQLKDKSKAFAAIFMRPYPIPIIVAQPALIPDNLGTVQYGLTESVQKVKQLYTDPFEGKLVPAGFTKQAGVSAENIFYHADDPNVIIRTEPMMQSFPNEYNYLTQNLIALRELKTFGIDIPSYKYVFGSDYKTDEEKTYLVTQRVNGQGLDKISLAPGDHDAKNLLPQLERLFSGICNYIYVCPLPGFLRTDLVNTGGLMEWESGASQYMFGSLPGEKQKKIYLIDIGEATNYINNLSEKLIQYEWLIMTIKDIEQRLGGRSLDQARLVIAQAMKALSDGK